MDNQTLEMKMDKIINGSDEDVNDNEIMEMQMNQLNNVAPMSNEVVEEEVQVVDVPTVEDNAPEPVTQLQGIAGMVQKALGGESVMTPPVVQEQVVPTLPPDMVVAQNNNAEQNNIPTPPTVKPSSGKRGRAVKHTLDYAKLENEFVSNFNSLSKEEKYKLLLGVVNETSASLAKKLGFTPANRILMSVRGDRNLNEEKLNIVYNYFISNEDIKARPSILNLITKDMFIN